MDANDDGWLTWDEWSAFVLQESTHSIGNSSSGISISLFLNSLPDDRYTEPSAYHTALIFSIRSASVTVGEEKFIKYITCSRDGTFRVWSAQTRRHIATITVSSRVEPAWVTCCVPLPDLATHKNVAGVVAVFTLERKIVNYDMKNFAKINELSLEDDVLPLCCDAFRSVQ